MSSHRRGSLDLEGSVKWASRSWTGFRPDTTQESLSYLLSVDLLTSRLGHPKGPQRCPSKSGPLLGPSTPGGTSCDTTPPSSDPVPDTTHRLRLGGETLEILGSPESPGRIQVIRLRSWYTAPVSSLVDGSGERDTNLFLRPNKSPGVVLPPAPVPGTVSLSRSSLRPGGCPRDRTHDMVRPTTRNTTSEGWGPNVDPRHTGRVRTTPTTLTRVECLPF